jgi:hypothetical protein
VRTDARLGGMKNEATVTLAQYKVASDRIRKGKEHFGDLAVCLAYEAQPRPVQTVNAWYDLPVAAKMWRADGRQRRA